MYNILYLIVALNGVAVAASTQAITNTLTSTLAYQKQFDFLYGSSERDDLEVNVSTYAQGEEDGDDSIESDELIAGRLLTGNVTSSTRPTQVLSSILPGLPNVSHTFSVVPAVSTVKPETVEPKDALYTEHDMQQTMSNVQKRGTFGTDIHSNDVVWVTRYSYESITIPLPTVAPVTLTNYETVTEQQTVTQTNAPASGATATVTISAFNNSSQNAFNQGYDQGFNAGQWDCVTNATETSLIGKQAYDEGYVDGAHWGYRLGYSDGAARRPFALPEFATSEPVAPVLQTPIVQTPTLPPPIAPLYSTNANYPPQAPGYPYGYGYGYGGYGGYGGQGSPPQQPQAPLPPLPVSYTTVSYFVPYGGEPGPYYGGNQLDRQSASGVTPESGVATGTSIKRAPTAVAPTRGAPTTVVTIST